MKVLFQDFPGPKKKIQDFPGGVGTCTSHCLPSPSGVWGWSPAEIDFGAL